MGRVHNKEAFLVRLLRLESDGLSSIWSMLFVVDLDSDHSISVDFHQRVISIQSCFLVNVFDMAFGGVANLENHQHRHTT